MNDGMVENAGATLETSEKPQLPRDYQFIGEKQPEMAVSEPKTKSEEVETEQPESEGSEVPKKERRGGFQKKIAKRDAEIAELRQKLSKFEQQDSWKHAGGAQNGKPRLEDFKTYEDFSEALTDWKFGEAFKKREEEARSAKEVEGLREKAMAYEKAMDEAREKYSDFDDVIESAGDISNRALAKAVLNSDMPAEVAYALAKDPELLERLNNTTDEYTLGRAIGRVEFSLAESEKAKAAVKVSKAPPPVKPLSSKSSRPSFDASKDFTLEEFKEARAKGLI